MGDGKIKETAEAVTRLVKAVPVYDDPVQPAAKQAGELIASPLKIVNAIVRPILTAVQTASARLCAILEKRMNEIQRRSMCPRRPTLLDLSC